MIAVWLKSRSTRLPLGRLMSPITLPHNFFILKFSRLRVTWQYLIEALRGAGSRAWGGPPAAHQTPGGRHLQVSGWHLVSMCGQQPWTWCLHCELLFAIGAYHLWKNHHNDFKWALFRLESPATQICNSLCRLTIRETLLALWEGNPPCSSSILLTKGQ